MILHILDEAKGVADCRLVIGNALLQELTFRCNQPIRKIYCSSYVDTFIHKIYIFTDNYIG